MKKSLLFTMIAIMASLEAFSQTKDIIWSEDFEGDWLTDWYVDNGVWAVGSPTVGPDSALNGINCATTGLNGNYPNGADTRLIRFTTFIVPSTSEYPRLRFWHWYSFSDGDYGKVQVKVSGNPNWEDISDLYNNSGSSVWTYPSLDLSNYAGMTIEIAFYFHSEGYYNSVGWYIDDISLISGSLIFNNPEGFESGIGDWNSDRGTWEVGHSTVVPNGAYTGQQCAGTVLNGNYENGVDSRLISAPIIVPSTSEYPRLRFWHWYSFTDGDYGKVQVKVSGNPNWEDISDLYNNSSSSVWTYPSLDLSNYAGMTIEIAFYFHSEGYYNSVGWYIDDISLISGSLIFNNPEGFESGIGDWNSDRGTWEVGHSTVVPNGAHTGQQCAGTVLNGNYENGVDSRLISAPIIIPDSIQEPKIRFWHWFSFSDEDYGKMQIKVVDSLNWIDLTNPFQNTSGDWSPYLVTDLTSFYNKKVQFAFYFHSQGYYNNAGWYIDDLESLYKRNHDVGASKILSPTGIIEPDSTILPKAVVKNFGLNPEIFNTIFYVETLYSDTINTMLQPNQSDTIIFQSWIPNTEGTFNTNVKTFLPDDEDLRNDSLSSILVISSGAGPEIHNLTPNHGGNLGSIKMQIDGKHFIEGITAKLTSSGYSDIIADTSDIQFINYYKIDVVFDLSNATLGLWNLVLTNPDGKSTTFPNCYTIEEGKLDLSVNFTGPSPMGFRHPIDYFFTINNNGNNDVYGLPLWITVPKECILVVKSDLFFEPGFDSIPLGINSDTLFGEPYECQIFGFFITSIMVNETKTFHITLEPSSQLSQVEIKYWLGSPIIDYSDLNLKAGSLNDFADCMGSIMMLAIGAILPTECPKQIISVLWSTIVAQKRDFYSVTKGIAKIIIGCVSSANIPVKVTKTVLTLASKASLISSCGWFSGLFDGMINSLTIPVSSSADPNDKSASLGYGNNHYITSDQLSYYVIHFENVDTATAAAQYISITDTLSTNLDWSTFEFDSISLSPVTNNFNINTGVISWVFDTVNLPPNINPPEGEGWVMYHVNQKPGLPSGTQITNRASIKFDFNEPMLTETVLNTVDAGYPSSFVSPSATYIGDSTYQITWSGEDDENGSGIRDYTIYITDNLADGYQPWERNTASTTATFKGDVGKTYYFYSIARDGVGHEEAAPSTYDLALTVSLGTDENSISVPGYIRIYPNPFNDKTTIEFYNPSQDQYRLEIMDIYGNKVLVINGIYENKLEISKGKLNPGIYIVKLNGDKIIVGKMIVN